MATLIKLNQFCSHYFSADGSPKINNPFVIYIMESGKIRKGYQVSSLGAEKGKEQRSLPNYHVL